MRISPVQTSSYKNNKNNKNFRAIYVDDKFIKYNHLGTKEQNQIADWSEEFEKEYPNIDCFVVRCYLGDVKHGTRIYASEKKPNGKPNKPGFFGGVQYDVITNERLFSEDDWPVEFDCKKDPTNALDNLYAWMKFGIENIAEKRDLKPRVLAEKPWLAGEELVKAVEKEYDRIISEGAERYREYLRKQQAEEGK